MKRSASKQPQYKILTIDPWLKPYYSDIALRMQRHADTRRALLGDKADLSSFANGYLYYGIARTDDGWVYREWAPGADEMHLIGDFNDWNRESHPMTRLENGNWEIVLPGEDALMHGQRIKVQVTKNGEKFDRIPAYIRRVVRDPETNEFYGQVWAPNRPFRWTDGGYGKRKLSPCLSTNRTWAWRRRTSPSAPTANSPTAYSTASRKRATTPYSSWPSWSTPTTPPSAIR